MYKILEYVPLPDGSGTVCENRGSGIKAMVRSLRAAGMSLPQFTDEVSSFRVVFPSATLLDDDTVRWLGSLGQTGLTDGQVLALARMRRGEVLKNAAYRQDTGVDSRVATVELRDLVDRRLAIVDGTRGAATYSLAGRDDHEPQPEIEGQQSIDDALEGVSSQATGVPDIARATWKALEAGPKSRSELQADLGLEYHSVLYRLRILRELGLVEAIGALRSPQTRWRRAV